MATRRKAHPPEPSHYYRLEVKRLKALLGYYENVFFALRRLIDQALLGVKEEK